MKPASWMHASLAGLAVFLVALAIRIHQIGWGLPFVYEEAVPLKQAWEMWGWGTQSGISLNPQFFHYPSLTFYLHFLVQGLLFLSMKLFGFIGSGEDHYARYLVDPTPLYHASRSLSALFGAGSVWLTYKLGQRMAGRFAAVAAALILAVNTFHISRSHLIEVDLPLTFFALLALWLTLRLAERPSLKSFALAGIAIGLASSTKYTGAMLVLPLLAASAIVLKDVKTHLRWRGPVLSLAVALIAFLLTSPYVALDHATFVEHFSFERLHMQQGHFGLAESASPVFYFSSLTGNLLGWPAVILALAGLIHLVLIRRRPGGLILASFVVPYFLAISLWSMHAERYLLPALPALLIFATAFLALVLETVTGSVRARRLRAVVAGGMVIATAFPVTANYPAYLESIASDTRSTATDWIEANIPSGSFLVTELYGPSLFSPQMILKVKSGIRAKVLELKRGEPYYAVMQMPFFQLMPERSQVFFDHALYANADYFVTTGAVRSRYESAPIRFNQQLAFYKQLENTFEKVAEFEPGGGGGSVIRIYKNPRHREPFSARTAMAPLPPIRIDQGIPTGSEELFYFEMGMIFETFQQLPEAISSYDLAFRYPTRRPTVFKNLVVRKANCMLNLGDRRGAMDFLDEMTEQAPTPALRAQLEVVHDAVRKRGSDSGP